MPARNARKQNGGKKSSNTSRADEPTREKKSAHGPTSGNLVALAISAEWPYLLWGNTRVSLFQRYSLCKRVRLKHYSPNTDTLQLEAPANVKDLGRQQSLSEAWWPSWSGPSAKSAAWASCVTSPFQKPMAWNSPRWQISNPEQSDQGHTASSALHSDKQSSWNHWWAHPVDNIQWRRWEWSPWTKKSACRCPSHASRSFLGDQRHSKGSPRDRTALGEQPTSSNMLGSHRLDEATSTCKQGIALWPFVQSWNILKPKLPITRSAYSRPHTTSLRVFFLFRPQEIHGNSKCKLTVKLSNCLDAACHTVLELPDGPELFQKRTGPLLVGQAASQLLSTRFFETAWFRFEAQGAQFSCPNIGAVSAERSWCHRLRAPPNPAVPAGSSRRECWFSASPLRANTEMHWVSLSFPNLVTGLLSRTSKTEWKPTWWLPVFGSCQKVGCWRKPLKPTLHLNGHAINWSSSVCHGIRCPVPSKATDLLWIAGVGFPHPPKKSHEVFGPVSSWKSWVRLGLISFRYPKIKIVFIICQNILTRQNMAIWSVPKFQPISILLVWVKFQNQTNHLEMILQWAIWPSNRGDTGVSDCGAEWEKHLTSWKKKVQEKYTKKTFHKDVDCFSSS